MIKKRLVELLAHAKKIHCISGDLAVAVSALPDPSDFLRRYPACGRPVRRGHGSDGGW